MQTEYSICERYWVIKKKTTKDWLCQVRDTFVTKGYFQPSWKRHMCNEFCSIWVRIHIQSNLVNPNILVPMLFLFGLKTFGSSNTTNKFNMGCNRGRSVPGHLCSDYCRFGLPMSGLTRSDCNTYKLTCLVIIVDPYFTHSVYRPLETWIHWRIILFHVLCSILWSC